MHHAIRTIPLLALSSVVGLAACQPAPAPTVPEVSPSAVAPSAAPATAPAAFGSPTPSIAPSEGSGFVILSGKIYDDQLVLVKNATVVARSDEMPSLNQTINAIGGTWVLPNVPVGTTVSLTAIADGYTARTQFVKAKAPGVPPLATDNVYDFGSNGAGPGAKYALFQFPEIASVTPANHDQNATANPLVITMKLSHPLEAKEQDKFRSLFQVRFQAPNGDKIVQHHTLYGEEEARLEFNEAGDIATFRFNAPLVTRAGGDSAISIGLDDSVSIDQWPRARNGNKLGWDRANLTVDAMDVTARQRVAPFLRDLGAVTLPSPFPSPLSGIDLWGATHRTGIVFSLAKDTTGPKVVSVAAYRGINGTDDRFAVTFSEPVRGYPEEMIDRAVLLPSNYRFVLGKTSKPEDITAFKDANPATSGGSTSQPLVFSTTRYDVVYIPMPGGTFTDYTDFKLYVDPAIKDLAGNPLQTSSPDPVTGLADNVFQGRIQ